MNRRGFLKLFAGTAAGLAIAPQVSYFFAPVGGWKSDVIVHPVPSNLEMAKARMDAYYDGLREQANIWYCHPDQFKAASKILGQTHRIVVDPSFWSKTDPLTMVAV